MPRQSHSATVTVPVQQFYRPNEACGVLRIGMATLYRRIKAGEIKAGKVGGATLISHAEIERVTKARSTIVSRPSGGVEEAARA